MDDFPRVWREKQQFAKPDTATQFLYLFQSITQYVATPSLIMRTNQSIPMPPPSPAMAPTDKYSAPCVPKFVTMETLQELLCSILELRREPATPSSTPKPEYHSDAKAEDEQPRVRVRASKHKTVDEIWDTKEQKYKIADAIEKPEATQLDEYMFVVRIRTERDTSEVTAMIDIKSKPLGDALRTALQHVKVSIAADKPSVNRDLLYNCLPSLITYADSLDKTDIDQAKTAEHLGLLIEYIKVAYRETNQHLKALLAKRAITFPLLWALFKPGATLCTTCPGTGKPCGIIYEYGEIAKNLQNEEFFKLVGTHLDFDGKVFGKVQTTINIAKFPGELPVNQLAAFPLEYHHQKKKAVVSLQECGRKFIKMMDGHHCEYNGTAFFRSPDGICRLPYKGKLMVDASIFRKVNPGYPKLQNKISVFNMWSGESHDEFTDKVMYDSKGPSDLTDDDLLILPPTVFGFGLDDKFWGEFAIDNIHEIQWSEGIFDKLVLSQDKKDVIMAVTERHIGEGRDKSFDDFVPGKGHGLIVLLSGPPGVGKTLTAEALAEHYRRPLYRIPAGQLSMNAAKLDMELSRIFTTVHHWGAILLMDEADVFLTERSSEHIERNRLVATFLEKLERFEGIMFMTSNKNSMLDKAIESRIHLSIAYHNLNSDARKMIFTHFLERSQNDIEEKELNALAEVKVNGREIKNYISIALAIKERKKDGILSYLHIRSAYSANGHMLPDPDCGRIEVSLYD